MPAGFGGRLRGKGPGSGFLNPGPRRAAHPVTAVPCRALPRPSPEPDSCRNPSGGQVLSNGLCLTGSGRNVQSHGGFGEDTLTSARIDSARSWSFYESAVSPTITCVLLSYCSWSWAILHGNRPRPASHDLRISGARRPGWLSLLGELEVCLVGSPVVQIYE